MTDLSVIFVNKEVFEGVVPNGFLFGLMHLEGDAVYTFWGRLIEEAFSEIYARASLGKQYNMAQVGIQGEIGLIDWILYAFMEGVKDERDDKSGTGDGGVAR